MAENRSATRINVFSQPVDFLQPAGIPKFQFPGFSLKAPPADPLFVKQWYLLNQGQMGGTPGIDLNVVSVWEEYTGVGVRVGIVDDGVQYVHPDLRKNYNRAIDIDVSELDADPAPGSYDQHGTAVAGIIAAEAGNGLGGAGVAPEATIAGIRYDFNGLFGGGGAKDADALFYAGNFDVVNNSWEYSAPFTDNFSTPIFQPHGEALQAATQKGRNGLGTVICFAAGNDRAAGDNSNYRNLQNSRFVIAVAALTNQGRYASYSSPGANVLVSALGGEQGTGIVTTDRLGTPGYNFSGGSETADYTDGFTGTSAASPMIAGVAALMLEANPRLGYRDVQEILAYSARQTDVGNSGWGFNRAKNWNGGGLHISHDYGFGLVDAHAAVRLAETWTAQSTAANEKQVSVSRSTNLAIPDGAGELVDTVKIPFGVQIDHVEVSLDLTHAYLGDLEVVLTSPDGTESILVARPGVTELDRIGLNRANLQFTFSSTHHWGETGAGDWTLTLRDRLSGKTGTLNAWTLRLYGDSLSNGNTYIYTNEFANFVSDPARSTLSDSGGIDTINASAITSDLLVNLAPGSSNTLAGNTLNISPDTQIEQAFGGDGNDKLTGNAADNLLVGGRGNDTIASLAGNDTLNGGKGDDVLTGGEGSDRFLFASRAAFTPTATGTDTLTDFVSGIDQLVLSKATFAALTSVEGVGFSVADEFTSVADDAIAAVSNALIVYSQASGNLLYNPNRTEAGYGTGAPFATLMGKPLLAATDFLLQA